MLHIVHVPYFTVVGNFHVINPLYYIFQSHWVPTRSYWTPLPANEISLSLSHLVPEIIWSKVGLIHKNLLFDQFVPVFYLTFKSRWLHFLLFLVIDLNDVLIGFIFFYHALDPLPNIWWSIPPPTNFISQCSIYYLWVSISFLTKNGPMLYFFSVNCLSEAWLPLVSGIFYYCIVKCPRSNKLIQILILPHQCYHY